MYYSSVYFCLFHHKKFFIIWTWSEFVINQFWLIPPVLALLHGNCPLTFKLRSYFVFLQKLLSSGVFCKKGGFAAFARARRCCSLFLIKLLAWGLAVLLRGDSSVGIFPVWFVKFLRAPILMSICQQQLLIL